MEVLALGGEEAERGFPGLPRRRSERWRRRRPSSGGRKKKCEPCAAGRAVGLQSIFLASQPLFVLVPVPVDIKQAINGNNLEKWACVGISELGFHYQLCIADSRGKLKDTACARMIEILRRLDGTIRSPAMKRIYTAVIRPRMEYACAVWSGGPTGCLQRLQDSFAKRHSLSLPPLEKRFEYHTLVLFYRVRANLAPTYLSSLVPPLTWTKSGYSFRK